jgi:hypothetical protein
VIFKNFSAETGVKPDTLSGLRIEAEAEAEAGKYKTFKPEVKSYLFFGTPMTNKDNSLPDSGRETRE